MCDTRNQSCKCRKAVLKAYRELATEHGLPAAFAMEAACIVYKHHHPEDARDVARGKVETWVRTGCLH